MKSTPTNQSALDGASLGCSGWLAHIYIYIKIYIIPPLAWFEPVGFFWCPSHGRSTYSNSFSLFRFLLRWQKRIHFLSSWARQRFSCLNALSLCSRNDSTLTHTPRVLLYHTQTIVDFHRLPPSNIVFLLFVYLLSDRREMNLRLQSIGFISVFDDKLSLSCYPNFSFSRGVSTSSFVFVFPPLAKRQKKIYSNWFFLPFDFVSVCAIWWTMT